MFFKKYAFINRFLLMSLNEKQRMELKLVKIPVFRVVL